MKRAVPPLVTCKWLANEMASSSKQSLRIIDATWYLPGPKDSSPFTNSNSKPAKEQFEEKSIPGAVFLDIDGIADTKFTEIPVPHNLPSNDTFLREVLNLRSEDHAIVYDQLGVFSSPRGMYTIQAFGHSKVSVLDGGLPMWMKLGYPTTKGQIRTNAPSLPSAKKRKTKRHSIQWSIEDVEKNMKSEEFQVIDMRPAGRYEGTVKETRANTRSGHVPKSLNLPFVNLLRNIGDCDVPITLQSKDVILSAFKKAGVRVDDKIAFMCGSGLTACIGRLALEHADLDGDSAPVYDGSWAEYGADSLKTKVVVAKVPSC